VVIKILTALLILSSAIPGISQKADNFRQISLAEFKERISTEKAAVILDVRTADEVKDGIIPNALVLDFLSKKFENEVLKLNREKVYLIYCASGYRSGETVDFMKKNGFKAAYSLKPGFDGWVKAKLPVSKPSPN
jgi:rhodanese-related sulfurtransferase